MRMTYLKKKRPSGVITVYNPFPVSLLKIEEHMADVKETTGSSRSLAQPSVRAKSSFMCVRSGIRNQVPSLCGPKLRDQLSHTSLRQLQAKMETENHQVQELLQPLLNRENGFMKRVEERVSSCNLMVAKKYQNMYGHYLRHSNSKFNTADIKEKPYFQLHETTGEDRPATSCQAGSKNTWGQTQELSLTDRSFNKSAMSPANQLPQTLPNHLLPAFLNLPEKDEAKQNSSGKNNTMRYYISATSTLDERCHQRSCWFCRCECVQTRRFTAFKRTNDKI
ncbi:protein FAM228A isoform X5 [Girardinichthys multiradiatus]|uniref:protein FAM228A isoform X5 n=1 Tax=Girardinichthys multiradiatus TaxID=208333 RepID=UPI001FAB8F95|nr:protein FAM228A isoform X5 [Girardinichthys multiradiatus]